MNKILVINSGSSSIKFKIFEEDNIKIDIADGLIDKIGLEDGQMAIKYNGQKIKSNQTIPNHEVGIQEMLKLLIDNQVINDLNEITKIGHRVVQGGEYFNKAVLVTDKELAQIKELAKLAPLHNIPNALGIEVFSKLIPAAKNIAVFDTEFHHSMPEESYIFPVPYKWYTENKVRRYGAHGISHKFIANYMNEKMNNKSGLKIINCHLGNGASLAAILDGKCLQTSMGLTPLGGIMMGTRSGDIDPSILQYMSEQTGQSVSQLINSLNKESGLLGLSQYSSDLRDLAAKYEEGDKQVILAINIYITRIVEMIGSYYLRLGGLDALVFTAGIGENSALIRSLVTEKLAVLGIEINESANLENSEEISTSNSKVPVYVISTNEEYQIALEMTKF